MAALYYILSGGTLTELGAAGCGALVLRRATGSASVASWVCDAAADSAPVWPHNTEISVVRKTNGGANEVLFSGRVISPQGDGTPDSESVSYNAFDAWYDFEREVFQQSRAIVSAEGVLGSVTCSRILLGLADDGVTRLTVAQICSAAVGYAVSLGINIQAGTFDAPIQPPCDEFRDKTIAEIILRALKWQPDAVAWIDHSTTPPTFNVTRRSSMSSSSLVYTALDTCRIRSCPELQAPGVVINFEYTNARGRTVATQTAGSASALGCVRMTLPMEFDPGTPGPEQEIAVQALGDYATVAWWQRWVPYLPSDAILSDVLATPVVPEGYVNILTGGSIQDWMRTEKLVDAVEVTFTAKSECTIDGVDYAEKDLSVTLTITNAVTKRYIGKFTPPYTEAIPSSLADDFYAAVSALQYGGRLILTEEECTAARTLLGKKLNVTGAIAAWAAMGAVVVAVTEDFERGSSEITLGPQTHLSPQDTVELLRASRLRMIMTPLSRTDAGVKSDSTPDKAAASDRREAATAPGKMTRIQMSDTVEEE